MPLWYDFAVLVLSIGALGIVVGADAIRGWQGD